MAMDPRRRRRRQRRAGAIAAFVVLALGLAYFFESQATTTVIIVRYADTQPGDSGDQPLSPAGAMRSQELSRVLGDIDVVQGLDAILVTTLRAARDTAGPLARRLNLPVLDVDTSRPSRLARHILRDYKGKIVLVITDPETLPVLIPRFQGSKKVPPIADREFDSLYIVTVPWYGKVKTLRMHYGAHYLPASETDLPPVLPPQ